MLSSDTQDRFSPTVPDIYRQVPKYWDARKLCCNQPKFRTKRQTCSALCQKDANEIVNREDPDQTAPICGRQIKTITECKIPVFSLKGGPMLLE